jgi:nucleoside-diphosphate-sugar epimerase
MAGHEPSAVGRTPSAFQDVPFLRAELTDEAALMRSFKGSEAIVHLAAVPSPYHAPPLELLDVNVDGTFHVLEAAIGAQVSKLVFASSGAATGFSFPARARLPSYLPLDEQHPCEPDDVYGLSKLIGEAACARWTRAHGLSTICLRINHNWYLDLEGAKLAIAGDDTSGLVIEKTWRTYRRKLVQSGADIESERNIGASASSTHPRHLLFAVTDARDAAQALRLAIEDTSLTHDVLLINGDDTCSLVPSEELVARWFPLVPLRRSLPGYATLISHDRATQLLGYQPQYSWRQSDFAGWLAEVTEDGGADASSSFDE